MHSAGQPLPRPRSSDTCLLCPFPPAASVQHRALLFAVAEAAELLDCAQAAEAAAAVALDVPVEGGGEAGGPGQPASKAGSTQDVPVDLEDGKMSGDAGGPAGSPAPVAAAHSAAAPRPSALARLAGNPYVVSCIILLLLASPLPLAALVAAACWRAARALPALARSSSARRAGELELRGARFALLPSARPCIQHLFPAACQSAPWHACCSGAQPARPICPQVLACHHWNRGCCPGHCLEGQAWDAPTGQCARAPALGQGATAALAVRRRACCADPAHHFCPLPAACSSFPSLFSLLLFPPSFPMQEKALALEMKSLHLDPPRCCAPSPPAGHPRRPRPDPGCGGPTQLLPHLAAHVHHHHNLHLPAGHGAPLLTAHTSGRAVACTCMRPVLSAGSACCIAWRARGCCLVRPTLLQCSPDAAAGGGLAVPRRAAQVRAARAPASAQCLCPPPMLPLRRALTATTPTAPRSTMTVLGGTLGYLIMLNGTLAQSPYWVCAWTAAGSWLAGLLAPDRTLR